MVEESGLQCISNVAPRLSDWIANLAVKATPARLWCSSSEAYVTLQ